MNKSNFVIAVSVSSLVILVVVSVVVSLRFSDESVETYQGEKRSRLFNVFDGFSLCEIAIRQSIEGSLVSLESDDRAARYDDRSNMNQMFFTAVYRPSTNLFGALSHYDKQVFIRCDVSAATNVVDAVNIRPVDENDFTEVHRRPN